MTPKWNNYDILKLSLTAKINFKKGQKIINDFKTFDDFKKNVKDYPLLQKVSENLFDKGEVDTKFDIQLKTLEKNKGKFNFITFQDENYPILLRHIDDPPLVIYHWGELKNFKEKAAAIVGTRQNTFYGQIATEKISEFLSKNGVSVVSGLANGIDSIAHNATVKAGGHTMAVIASGLDKLSPSLSVKNAEKIVDSGGTIMSTFEFGRTALPQFFLLRNRIICGMSKITIVVESDKKGGSLWTAKFANDYNRDVYAVPGEIRSAKSLGTNQLIKDNLAIILNNFDDLLTHFDISVSEKESSILPEKEIYENPNWNIIVSKLSLEPIHIDTLSEVVGIEMPMLLVNLLEMEFDGVVRQLPGKYYILT